MTNFKLTIAYDGTDFQGWQIQPTGRTIQGTIEKALEKLINQKVKIIGAGRTDAGVHASAQVANFKADLKIEINLLPKALNATLPHDIRILKVEIVDDNFHARKMAKSKIYQYRILNSQIVSPFLFRYVLHYPYHLNIKKMKEAAKLFVGEKDLSSFSSSQMRNKIRRMLRSEISQSGEEIIYLIEANGFLRYMVRTIVGTLLEVGRGKIKPEFLKEIFVKKDRSLAGPTAPAKGLCLERVVY
ncbi:MAG: tRNA pseudouridine(38-40) synthase TruA [Candidatus Aminicenantia bacterium]